jgi:hypothetical protein
MHFCIFYLRMQAAQHRACQNNITDGAEADDEKFWHRDKGKKNSRKPVPGN